VSTVSISLSNPHCARLLPFLQLGGKYMSERRRNWYAFYCDDFKPPFSGLVADCVTPVPFANKTLLNRKRRPHFKCFTSEDSNWFVCACVSNSNVVQELVKEFTSLSDAQVAECCAGAPESYARASPGYKSRTKLATPNFGRLLTTYCKCMTTCGIIGSSLFALISIFATRSCVFGSSQTPNARLGTASRRSQIRWILSED